MSNPSRPNSRDYEIIIDWSDEDQCYVVKIPDLPGCMCHGETREEAARNAGEAIEFYLGCLGQENRPIPKPRSNLVVGPES